MLFTAQQVLSRLLFAFAPLNPRCHGVVRRALEEITVQERNRKLGESTVFIVSSRQIALSQGVTFPERTKIMPLCTCFDYFLLFLILIR